MLFYHCYNSETILPGLVRLLVLYTSTVNEFKSSEQTKFIEIACLRFNGEVNTNVINRNYHQWCSNQNQK